MIRNQTYNIINLALTKEVITSYIKIFWDDVFKSIHNKKSGSSHLMLLVKVEFTEGMGHRTLAHKVNKIIINFNKYLYIWSFIAIILNNISKFRNYKFINLLYNIIKIFLFISIFLSFSIIVYFSDFSSTLNSLPSIYYDLLEPYIEIVKYFYNKLINNINHYIDLISNKTTSVLTSNDRSLNIETQIKNAIKSGIQEGSLNIESEIKSGIKSGIKEALEDVIEDLETESNNKFYRNVIIFFSLAAGVYIYFYLPGSDVDINNFNTINQYLINIKISIMDFFSKPSNPGTPGGSTISLPISEASSVFTQSPSIVSESLPTITPNTPVATVQTLSQYVDQSVSTTLDGITVSKLVETQSIIADNVDDETANMIVEHCQKSIKNITD